MRRLSELKGHVFTFFSSNKWIESLYANKKQKKICSIVFDNQEFWQNMELYLKIASFHIKVLRMVDSDDKPTTVFSTRQLTALKKIQAKC